MKVIHFVPYYPPEQVGGVGEFVAGLHQALLDSGHDSLVVTSGTQSEPTVRRIAQRSLGWLWKSMAWARLAATYDIVHCQSGDAFPLLICLALRRKRGKIVTTFHISSLGMRAAWQPYVIEGQTFATGLREFVYRTLVCWIHHLFDRGAVCLSDAVNTISRASAREVLGEEAAKNTAIIYYGLAPLPAIMTLPKPVDLLYVGVGGHRKRVVSLAFVLRYIRDVIPQARLRVIGFEPHTEPELLALCEQYGLVSAVEFLGRKTSAELPAYYAQARILLVPSAYEGLPFVILEAMRSGLPVVATRVSGHPEVIQDGQNGFLVDLDCPRHMAQRCIQLLRDNALRARLGQAAQATIQTRFGLNRQLQDYLKLYAACQNE